MLGSSTPGQVWQTTNCHAAAGMIVGRRDPTWELVMVLGLEFLA